MPAHSLPAGWVLISVATLLFWVAPWPFSHLVLNAQEQGSQEQSQDLNTLLGRGSRALEAGDAQAAAEAFRAARELQVDSPLPLLGLAAVADRVGESLEALRWARQAAELGPDLAAAQRVLGRLLARLGAKEEALATYTRLRSLQPTASDAYLMPALVLRDQGRHEEAIALLSTAREKGAETEEVLEQLGLLHLAAGQVSEAQRVAREALDQEPRSAVLARLLGLALAADPARRSEAIPWLSLALEQGVPEPGRLRLELVELLQEAGQGDEALYQLRRATEELPEDPQAHYRLGTALRATGDMEGAREALQRFRSLSQERDSGEWDEKRVGTVLNEVQGLASSNQLQEALAQLEQLLEARPENTRAWVLRSKIRFSMGQAEEALADASKAVDLEPGWTEPRYLRGLCLANLGRLQEAETELQQSLALDPKLGAAHLLLGQLAERAGAQSRALQHYREAAASGSGSKVLERRIQELAAALGEEAAVREPGR